MVLNAPHLSSRSTSLVERDLCEEEEEELCCAVAQGGGGDSTDGDGDGDGGGVVWVEVSRAGLDTDAVVPTSGEEA